MKVTINLARRYITLLLMMITMIRQNYVEIVYTKHENLKNLKE